MPVAFAYFALSLHDDSRFGKVELDGTVFITTIQRGVTFKITLHDIGPWMPETIAIAHRKYGVTSTYSSNKLRRR